MLPDPFVLDSTAPTGATLAVAFTGAGSTNASYAAISRGPTSSTYRFSISSSHYVDMFVGRQTAKNGRTRYTVRLTETELVADPITPAINSRKTATIYIVGDIGVLGTTSNWVQMLHGLSRFLYKPTDTTQKFDLVVAGNT